MYVTEMAEVAVMRVQLDERICDLVRLRNSWLRTWFEDFTVEKVLKAIQYGDTKIIIDGFAFYKELFSITFGAEMLREAQFRTILCDLALEGIINACNKINDKGEVAVKCSSKWYWKRESPRLTLTATRLKSRD